MHVRLPLTDDPGHDPLPSCSACAGPCPHGLRAVAVARRRLAEGDPAWVKALGRPPWQAWLGTLTAALQTLGARRAESARSRLGWAVDLDERALRPQVLEPGRSGALGAPRRATARDLEEVLELTEVDRRAVAAARWHRVRRREAARAGEAEQTFLTALEGLAGHPRVWVGRPGGRTWSVERVPLGTRLHREPEGLRLELTAGAHAMERERAARARAGERLLFVDREARRLDLLVVDRARIDLIRAWGRGVVPVPEEAAPTVLSALAEVGALLPLEAGDDVAEHAIEGSTTVVAVARPTKAGLSLELRARPIPEGPLVRAGVEPAELLAPNPDRDLVRARRDLAAERRALERVVRRAGLPDLDPHDHCTLDGLADAVETTRALEEMPGVELVWPELRWRRGGTITAERLKLSVELKHDWLDVRGGAVLDGRRIELAVLAEAARRDRGWVVTRGGTVTRLEEALVERLARLAQLTERRGGLPRAGLEIALELCDRAEGDVGPELDRWLERRAAALAAEPDLPPALAAVLRPYQQEGFRWMARLARLGMGAILADDMGLGKTVQAIAMLVERAAEGPQIVIAPTSVGFNWRRELIRFAPGLSVVDYTGADRRARLDGLGPGQVLITSYGVLTRDAEPLARRRFATLVLDEAQALKNPRTLRARSARRLQAEWSLALTGTPVENDATELWSLFSVVSPGLLGSLERFREHFVGEDGVAVGSASLRKAIRPYVLRRTKAEVAVELPPKTEVVVDVELSPRERALYDDARLAAVARLRKLDVAEQTHLNVTVLAALTRLRQLACHPRLVDPRSRVASSKLERLLELVVDLRAEGRRPLVFSQFTAQLELVRAALEDRGLEVLLLEGRTAPTTRARVVDAFQAGEGDVFLLSLKAGGTGLNLTATDAVVHLDPWWNPAAEDQATDRAHRIGQASPVTVFRLIAVDTIEAKMMAMNEQKRRLVTDLLDGSAAPASLDTRALLALIEGGESAEAPPERGAAAPEPG